MKTFFIIRDKNYLKGYLTNYRSGTMGKINGAKALAKTLRAFDTEYVFYIPGYGVPIRDISDEGLKLS